MAGSKSTSRQKLINMMYLVLTAMLALNVSKEILDSFITIDTSQTLTRLTAEEKLKVRLDTFKLRALEKPEKFALKYEQAEELHSTANDLMSYINRIKATCISETEGLELTEVYNAEADTVLKIEFVARKDNYDANTNIMFGSEEVAATKPRIGDLENLRATALKAKLISFRDLVIEKVTDPATRSSIESSFSFGTRKDSEGNEQSWERMNFYHVPLAASQSILSKIQSDIRSAEEDAIDVLFGDVERKTMKFTKLKEAVIPVSTDISQGGKFQAEIFLAAYDDTNPPEIRLAAVGSTVNETSMEIEGDYAVMEVDSNMIGNVEILAPSLGQQHREGLIIFRPAGLPEVRKKFVLDYTVLSPTLVVSPTKMNVFYKGLENPVSISVPGFQDSDLSPRIDNGTLTKVSSGEYIVKVNSGSVSKIFVTAQLPDGGTKTVGPMSFRLKTVPDPIAKFAGKTSEDSKVRKRELTAASGVLAFMKDFEFEADFTVVSFELEMELRGQLLEATSNSNRLTREQKTMIDEVRNGQRIFIENIKVRGPSGQIRKLAPISLKVTS